MTTPPGTASAGETPPLQGITEQDIAEYLVHTPGFFERPARTDTAPCRCRSGRWRCCASASRAWR
jgi:hypothetical protein